MIPRQDQPAIARKLDTDIVLSEAGTRRAAMMKTHKGRAKVMRECPHCLMEYGTVEWRKHVPRCFLKPATGSKLKINAT